MRPAHRAHALLQHLRLHIQQHGAMPLDAFMHACLADPEHGYWRKSATIGAAGDFVTAPEISQIFGELIGLWAAVVWQRLAGPPGMRLVELGPGRGTLMRDALRAAKTVPAFLAAASIHLVERSAALRQTQRQMLAVPPAAGLAMAPQVAWHNSLADVPAGNALIIANEFLDALPIRQLLFMGDAWHERVVDVDPAGGLKFAAGKQVIFEALVQPHPGDIIELRPAEEELLACIAGRRDPCVALFIDYGPAAAGVGETLQAVSRHAYVDPLADPGNADITAHVQFASLAAKARAAGLAADGPMSQAEFLGRLGMAERAARLMAANPACAGAIETGVQRLMAPTGMGELFKVMVVRSGDLPPPPPFG
jgi:NADH dehydrogenase [ubiquinone] 1 alpha subcomplex assembly factor 7